MALELERSSRTPVHSELSERSTLPSQAYALPSSIAVDQRKAENTGSQDQNTFEIRRDRTKHYRPGSARKTRRPTNLRSSNTPRERVVHSQMQTCGQSLRGCLRALPRTRHVAALWQPGHRAAHEASVRLQVQQLPCPPAGPSRSLPHAVASQRLYATARATQTSASAPADKSPAGATIAWSSMPLHINHSMHRRPSCACRNE